MKICPSCRAPCLDAHRHCPGCGADIAAVPEQQGDPYLGATIAGRYLIEELLGAGEMGLVYRARHLGLDRDVAIKLVNPDAVADPGTVARFHQEARAASRLRHPNTIAVVDFGQTETGLLYLVTEMLRGRTLSQVLREEGALPPARIADLLGQGLAALHAAHEAGIIHRDFKPANLFVQARAGGGEQVKVIDFGMAKLRGERGETDPTITGTGVVCGTPDYMSPEQIRGDDLDPRSDVYAAGVVLYELATGTRPFRGALLDVLRKHLSTPPEPPGLRRRDLPPELEMVCLRALGKLPEERFATAEEMRRALLATVREEARRCAVCEEELADRARFCAACGASIETALPSEAGDEAGEGVHPTARRAVQHGEPLPFVGREAELAALDASARQGSVLVLGPPGSGRSRLCEEWSAGLDGRVVVMRPDPTGAQESWLPVRRALASLLGLVERPTVEELEAAAVQKTDLLGLRELFGLNPPASALEMELRRREAAAAAASTLRAAGAPPLAAPLVGAPTTLVCEDVDRYDRPSLELAAQLAAAPGALRLVVTATRRGEFAAMPTITLGPLSLDALRSLGVDEEEARAVGGLPLGVEQVLRAREEAALAAHSFDGSEPPLEVRLGLLAAAERRTLEAMVVAGVEVEPALLGRALPGEEVPALVEALARRGFVRHAGLRLELPSPTLRDRIDQAIDRATRRALHQAWQQVLASTGASPMVIAHHAWVAAPDAAAIDVLERAAAAATARHDARGAARWSTRALDRARTSAAPAERLRLAVALGDALAAAGNLAQAEVAWGEAIALLASAADPRSEALARRGLGRMQRARDQPQRADEELRRALAAARREGDGELIAELALELAELAAHRGHHAVAAELLDEGLRAADEPAMVFRLLLGAAEAALAAGNAADALRTGGEALQVAETVSPSATARVRALLGRACHVAGDPVGAAAHRRIALEALGRAGDRRATAELLLASVPDDGPNPDAAARWLRLAGDLAQQIGWREGVVGAREALSRLHAKTG